MIIRDYRKGDFEQVVALWKATGIFDPGRLDSEERILHCNALGGKFLVLEDPVSGTLAATSWMTYDGRRIHMHHFAVQPEWQGRGFGKMLAEASLKFAGSKGCPVKLEVHSANLPAIGLYKKFGFQPFKDYLVLMNRPTKSDPSL